MCPWTRCRVVGLAVSGPFFFFSRLRLQEGCGKLASLCASPSNFFFYSSLVALSSLQAVTKAEGMCRGTLRALSQILPRPGAVAAMTRGGSKWDGHAI